MTASHLSHEASRHGWCYHRVGDSDLHKVPCGTGPDIGASEYCDGVFLPQRTQRTQRRLRMKGFRIEMRRTHSFPGSVSSVSLWLRIPKSPGS